jgi:hypothetical protein
MPDLHLVPVASVETILGEGVESTVTARTFAVVNFDRDGYIGIPNRTDANGTSGDHQESIDTSGVGARRVLHGHAVDQELAVGRHSRAELRLKGTSLSVTRTPS